MNRQDATKYLRARLDELNLSDWKYKLTTDMSGVVGLCDGRNKTIVLNALAIDQHPESEIKDTINHEIAHALTPNDNTHGIEWQQKAIELGATPKPCSLYAFSAQVLE